MKLRACLVLCWAFASPAAPSRAAGDAVHGKALYESLCTGCHSVEDHRVGPAHCGVFGRKAGTSPGFAYSRALKQANLVWNETSLTAWLTNPEQLIPGQAMNFQLDNAQVRIDIVAFLRGLVPGKVCWRPNRE